MTVAARPPLDRAAHLTALLVPSMVERGRGGVLNIGSGEG